MNAKTVLVGLDGATFTILDPLMEAGVMPFLRQFLARGTRASLRTVVPALTPPAWTSLMTGCRPGRHGVFDFFRLVSPETRHIRFFTSHDVAVPTVWSLAARHGLRVTALNFPAMFPPPELPGYVVPGWVPWKQLRLACWPEGLFERLKARPDFNPRELAMDFKLEERATEGCSDTNEFRPWVELHIRREQAWFNICRELESSDPSALTGVLFDGMDKLQHLCWRFLRPEDGTPLKADWELDLRGLCLDYYRRLDAIIGEIALQAGPEATVIIASDHGFGPTRDVFHLNTWLERHGYLAWAEERGASAAGGPLLGVGQVARHTFLMDWTRTTAFATTPTSNGVYIAVNRDGNSPGIAPAEYHGFRDRLMDQLSEVRDPGSGERMITEIWTRERAFAGPFQELAPDLTLVLRDGGLISILRSEQPFSKRPSVSGAHRPAGFFAAAGPGIRRGVCLDEISILDVAPAILYSLGLPIPASMEGRLPSRIFERDFLAARSPRLEEDAAMDDVRTADQSPPPLSPGDEQIVLDRLRQLGYIE
ncbi:MAG: alkaline phosphatase family protein [Bryobacteraceae bacterium]